MDLSLYKLEDRLDPVEVISNQAVLRIVAVSPNDFVGIFRLNIDDSHLLGVELIDPASRGKGRVLGGRRRLSSCRWHGPKSKFVRKIMRAACVIVGIG